MSIAPFLVPVAGGRISGEIVAQVVALLREGKLAEGDRLPSERELSERFGVSRVTVRDALRVLEATGLVAIRVGAAGGAFVTAPSTELLGEGLTNLLLMSSLSPEDVVEARRIVELGILDLVLQRADADDIAGLREICEQSQAALERGEYDTALSNEFHARLATAAHNQAIQMLATSFRGPLSMAVVRRDEPEAGRHVRSVAAHLELVDAIEQRDRRRAVRVLTRHLSSG